MNLMQKYLSQAMLTEYEKFIHWLASYNVTVDDIEAQNPDLLKEIHKKIEIMDRYFNNENYQDFLDAMKEVRELYLEAVKENEKSGT